MPMASASDGLSVPRTKSKPGGSGISQSAGIIGVDLRDDADSLTAAESNLPFGVDLVARADDPLGQLLADAFHAAKIARRCGQDRGRITEAVQEPPPNPWPDAFDHGEANRVDQVGVGRMH